jgi:hypothetical protein
MALDVGYGLKYLSELKVVHRYAQRVLDGFDLQMLSLICSDLACRNCLVHVTKRIKIGDFGMARSMYDSDYYRFNKRGFYLQILNVNYLCIRILQFYRDATGQVDGSREPHLGLIHPKF